MLTSMGRFVTGALALALAIAPTATAHTPSVDASEAATLGLDHAREHARLAAELEAMARIPSGALRTLRARERAALAALPVGASGDDGAWDPTFGVPSYAMHAAMLPTGKVLMFGFPSLTNTIDYGGNNFGVAWLWDPTQGTGQSAFESVPPPEVDIEMTGLRPAPIYCSGFAFAANGTLVVVGGNRRLAGEQGDSWVFTFDPFAEEWHVQQRMAGGRWYPTAVELPDGRVAIMSGWTEAGDGNVNDDFEVFPAANAAVPEATPAGRAATGLPTGHVASLDRATELYPHLRVMPSGRLALLGPIAHDSAILDGAVFGANPTWLDLPDLLPHTAAATARIGGNAVLLPGGVGGPTQVALFGGYAGGPADEDPATARADVISPDDTSPSWTTHSTFVAARHEQNTVILPDGSLVAVGGSPSYLGTPNAYGEVGKRNAGSTPAERALMKSPELFDPTTGQWRLGPPMAFARAYHGVAFLMPDGSVLATGDDLQMKNQYGVATGDFVVGNAQIYRPAYMFAAARPTIEAAPPQIAFGSAFPVQTPDAASITRAVLIAPSATSHAEDSTQRSVEVAIVARTDRRLTLRAPGSGNIAPPGYYMLFVLRGGVPSVAKFVRIGEAGIEPEQITSQFLPWDPEPPVVPPPPTPTPAPGAPTALAGASRSGFVHLTWTAVAGAASYEVTRDGARVVVTPTPTVVVGGLRPDTTYTFGVVAIDASGRRSDATTLTARTLSRVTYRVVDRSTTGLVLIVAGSRRARIAIRPTLAGRSLGAAVRVRISRRGVRVTLPFDAAGRRRIAGGGWRRTTPRVAVRRSRWDVIARRG